jgi:4-hydroxybenzoate polyprenyltransferase
VRSDLEKWNPMNTSDIFHTGIVLLSLSAASMALFFSILFFKVFSFTYFFAVFLLTYAVYSMDRLASLEKDELSHPQRTRFLRKNKNLFALSSVLAFSTSIILAALSNWIFVVLIPVAAIVVMLYSGDLSQKVFGSRRPNVKQYFVVKDIAVASGWGLLLLTTSIFLNQPFTYEQWIFVIPLLMKLFIMAVVYDFKDINSDLQDGVRSLPIVLGEHPTKVLLHFLNIMATIMILLLTFLGILPFLSLVFAPAFLYQFIMIQKVRRDAPDWVYFVLCDLEQFFWLLFIVTGVLVVGLS